MPIDLTLGRVTRLLAHLKNPHNTYLSVHIAGTNGKGSIAAYISSILTTADIQNGRFTSPHLTSPNDSVCINSVAYPQTKFLQVSRHVSQCDAQLNTKCTEFELLTVTAFMIFQLEKVKIAVIEVGLGGRLDATNVLRPVQRSYGPGDCNFNSLGTGADTGATLDNRAILSTESARPPDDLQQGGVIATAISKIGLDHEGILGNTIKEIALQKAGIIKPTVPCVVDATNSPQALEVIKATADKNKSPLHLISEESTAPDLLQLTPLKGDYQKQNLSVALATVELIRQKYRDTVPISDTHIANGIALTQWRGRLEVIRIPGFDEDIILDGAHNESAAIELARFLNTIRSRDGFIFIVAMTEGKDSSKLLLHIADRGADTVVATTFTVPEQMPWIKPMAVRQLCDVATSFVDDAIENSDDIGSVLSLVLAAKKANADPRPIVICGSLYLCGDVLRFLERQKA